MRTALTLILTSAAVAAGADRVLVDKVYDGNSFLTSDSQQVILLGVDVPAIHLPGGDISRDVFEKLVRGRRVRLEADSDDPDDRGGLRRYVFCGDTLVNAMMLHKGFGALSADSASLRRKDTLRSLELAAARIGKGLWPFDVFPEPEGLTRPGEIDRYLVDDDRSGLPGFKVVSWADADKHYGRLVRVVGTVVATYRSDKVFIMNFHQDYRRYFKVAVFARDLHKFPARPEDFYKKRIVRVTGTVREYEGAPEMVVNDPGQIEVLE
ncbi:MAG: thermonuclease family protein [candidate division WOR-3 bacterium]|nr:MAG: thermonuclease family protein [candidate division WOR-3 bacterium]